VFQRSDVGVPGRGTSQWSTVGLRSTFAGCSFLGPPYHTRLSGSFAFSLRLSSGTGGGHFLRNAFSSSWFLGLSLRVFQRIQCPLYAGLGNRKRILKFANDIFYSHIASCQNGASFASPHNVKFTNAPLVHLVLAPARSDRHALASSLLLGAT
jgi:hypothetical protein